MVRKYTKVVHNDNLSYSYKEALVHKICKLSKFLPTTFDEKINDTKLTITMEHLHLKLKKPNLEKKMNAWLDILQAVALLNSFGIAHRDIKSDNIMYRSGEQAVLIDFGLSKKLIGECHTPDVISYYYRPPELDEDADEQEYGLEVDSWSLGVWALELFHQNFRYQEFHSKWFDEDYDEYLESVPEQIRQIVASFLLTCDDRSTTLDWVELENPKKLFYFPSEFIIDVPHKVSEWGYGYKCVAWGLKQEYPDITDKELEATALWLTSMLFLPYQFSIESLAESYEMDSDRINEMALNWFIKWKVHK